MDTISSAEFRKHYAKLTRATQVTVNGHIIGEWWPRDLLPQLKRDAAGELHLDREPTFNSRPFTPVPKVRK